jgi:hypothetical protein
MSLTIPATDLAVGLFSPAFRTINLSLLQHLVSVSLDPFILFQSGVQGNRVLNKLKLQRSAVAAGILIPDSSQWPPKVMNTP